MKNLTSPLDDETVNGLRAGEVVSLNGVVYTARDAAHKRLIETLDQGRPLPVDLRGQILYYVGPTPPRPGRVIGSAGPTTAYRMDAHTPRLLALGLKGMIAKGGRSQAVVEAMKKHGAVYFAAVGGAAALLAGAIVASEVVAYEDLGAEAIRRLVFKDFPAVVAIDCRGGNQYLNGPAEYLRGAGKQ